MDKKIWWQKIKNQWYKLGQTASALILTLAVLVVIVFGLGLGLAYAYQDRIFPNVALGGLSLGGLKEAQARELLENYNETIKKNIYILRFGQAADSSNGQELRLSAYGLGEAADISNSQPYYFLNTESSATLAYRWGRTGSWFSRGLEIWQALLGQADQPIELTADFVALENSIKVASTEFLDQAEDAHFVWEKNKLEVIEEKTGKIFDLEEALKKLRQQITRGEIKSIEVKTIYAEPTLKTADLEKLKPTLEKVVKKLPLVIADSAGRTYYFAAEDLLHFLTLAKSAEGEIYWQVAAEKNQAEAMRLQQYFSLTNQATFLVENEKLVFVSKIKRGQGLDIATTFVSINEALKSETRIKKIMATTVDLSQDDLDFSPAELGLKEIVATGESDFRGSPKNRINNIKVGVRSLNGVLIAPGETFSILKALGAISSAKGYLPELVIKQGKTVPELGGGLCQVSTTAFRVALSAGVPIIERYNHAYRVPYYEPAGTDATIYDPTLDFKFKNDFKSYLMFQTEIVGTKVLYYLWGTSDGRKVVNPKPAVYNIVPPPEKLIIEDAEMSEGETKCTEKPHSGASTSFTQTITRANGEKKETVFASKYRPWQEVCLVGTKKDGTTVPTISAPLPIPDLLPAPSVGSPFTQTR